ncbi:MerR family transcriptional regulator [Bacillus toyonensis]|nr:MerR family transcriptional regulator [Bacillus toyonensis]MDT3499191.1 MerR family transcriptional regulator [Bacillus toyonensis]
MGDTFSIKQIAEQTGLSKDTIRYYEKIQLLPHAKRKANGHRVYSSADKDTLSMITCLKKTGMSLNEMKPYLQFSLESDIKSVSKLYDMLQDYKKNIKSQMEELQKILDLIDYKLVHGEKFGVRDRAGQNN